MHQILPTFSHLALLTIGALKTTLFVSVESHCSLKSPRAKQRCGRLAQWGWTKYPYLEFGADYPATYGIIQKP